MLSTLLELAGFAALAAAAFLIAGLAALMLVAGAECLVLGLALDGTAQRVVRPRKPKKR